MNHKIANRPPQIILSQKELLPFSKSQHKLSHRTKLTFEKGTIEKIHFVEGYSIKRTDGKQ